MICDSESAAAGPVEIDETFIRHDEPFWGERTRNVIAQHVQTGKLYWSGMKCNHLPYKKWFDDLRCCEYGCQLPVEGYIYKRGESSTLELIHDCETPVQHFLSRQIISEITPRILKTKMVFSMCRACRKKDYTDYIFKKPFLIKTKGGICVQTTVDGVVVALVVLYKRSYLKYFPFVVHESPRCIIVSVQDLLRIPFTVPFVVPGITSYNFCRIHQFDVRYPLSLLLKFCPQCKTWHSPIMLENNTYECSFEKFKMIARYRLWNLDKKGNKQPIKEPTKIRTRHFRTLVMYTCLRQEFVNKYLPIPARVVRPRICKDIFPTQFEAEIPERVICNDCDADNKRKKPVCPICRGDPMCTTCIPEVKPLIRKRFLGTSGDLVHCFKCAWIDHAFNMACFKAGTKFIYDREGHKSPLYLCENCYSCCERCAAPCATEESMCYRCIRSRHKANAFSVVHSDHAHMKTTSTFI